MSTHVAATSAENAMNQTKNNSDASARDTNKAQTATAQNTKKTVCAVVVTFRRAELLRQCLHAIQNQARAPDTILVVDNNSGDGTLEMLHGEFPDVSVLALNRNSGGAGGFHAGMKWAVERGFDWIWVMDDDGQSDPECLRHLTEKAEKLGAAVYGAMCVRPDDATQLSFPSPLSDEFGQATTQVAVLKEAQDDLGVLRGWAAFMNSVLFAREVVLQAGLPRAEMFIWGDEVEYAKRIKAHGFDLYTVFPAVHVHPADRIQWTSVVRPSWTVYAGPLDWKAFCFFRNAGFIARNFGRGKGVSMLARYLTYFLFVRRLDLRSLRFFLRAYCAGWRSDFSRPVPY